MFFTKEKDFKKYAKANTETVKDLFEIITGQGLHFDELEERLAKVEGQLEIIRKQNEEKLEAAKKQVEEQEKVIRDMEAIQSFSLDDVIREIRKGVE